MGMLTPEDFKRRTKSTLYWVSSLSGVAALVTGFSYLLGYLRAQLLFSEVNLSIMPTDVYDHHIILISGGVLLFRALLLPSILFFGTAGVLICMNTKKLKNRGAIILSGLLVSIFLFFFWAFRFYQPDLWPLTRLLFPEFVRGFSQLLLVVALCSLPTLVLVMFLWQRRIVTVLVGIIFVALVIGIAIHDSTNTSQRASSGTTISTSYLYPAVYGVLYTKMPVCPESTPLTLTLKDGNHSEKLYAVGGMILNHRNGLWYCVPGWGGARYKAEDDEHSASLQLLEVPDSSVVSVRMRSRWEAQFE